MSNTNPQNFQDDSASKEQEISNNQLPKVWKASDMEPSKPVRWVVLKTLPRGAVTLLIGDEGIGKSLYWVLLVAHLTTGKGCPELGIPAGEPKHVVLLLAENGFSDMDRPRLEALGADLDYIHVIAVDSDGTGAPSFDFYTQSLIEDMGEDIALIVADPWLDTVPANLNVKDGQQAKRALRPWRETAIKKDCAVLLVAHTNRTSASSARDRYGATAELRKTARMSLYAQVDQETELLSIGAEKSNLIQAGSKAKLFSIQSKPRDGWDEEVPFLRFEGESNKTVADLIAEDFEEKRTNGEASPASEVDEVLLSILAHGSVQANDVYKQCEAAGVSRDQAKRAKKRLKIKSIKMGEVWEWFPPDGGGTHQGSTQPPISLNSAPLLPSSSEGYSKVLPSQGDQQGSKSAREHKHRVTPRDEFFQHPETPAEPTPGSDLNITEEQRDKVLDFLQEDYGLSPHVIAGSLQLTEEHVQAILQDLETKNLAYAKKGKYQKVVKAA